MLKDKRKFVALAALAIFSLTSCDTDYVRYPLDYSDTLYPLPEGESVYGNDRENYYSNVMTGDTVYEHLVEKIIQDIAKIAHNNTGGNSGSDVSHIIDDTYKGSVQDGEIPTGEFDNLLTRGKETLLSNARSSTYTEDNLFYEENFVRSLQENFTLPIDFDESKVNQEGILVTPFMDVEDIFGADYTEYLEKQVYPDIIHQYLTSEFIYTKTFSSIGNTNARNIQAIALTDRSDAPGSARRLLEAYIGDYIRGDGNHPELCGTDPEFEILSKLWKGITKEAVDSIVNPDDYEGGESDPAYLDDIASYEARYASVILTEEEENWLKEYGIITDTSSYTLTGDILNDQKILEDGIENPDLVDSSIESEYTGTYTYDYQTGIRLAYDSIATRDLVTDGIYLSSDTSLSLPSALTERLFSTSFTTDKDDIAQMKADGQNNINSRIDITTYQKDGSRYLTTANTVASNADSIIYYDADSSTYYLTRVLDVITTDALGRTAGTPNANSVYDTAEKQEQIAREVAYKMSTTGTYANDSLIYWLRRTEIDYSDENFLTYMKTNYQDLFRTESAYDGDPIITLE